MLRRMAHPRDDGFTVAEAVVSFFMLTLLALAVGGLLANSQKLRAQTQRADAAAATIAKVVELSQQVPFTSLGYYADDEGAPDASEPIALPLWRTPAGAVSNDPASCTVEPCPARIAEAPVVLGAARPAGTAPFHPATTTVSVEGVEYRIDTWVTSPGDGTRRLTVQAEWPAGDGTCQETNCLVETFARAPVSYENTPDGQHVPEKCRSDELEICEAYVQGGRVLEGGSFVSEGSHARQVAPVLLQLSTTKPVSSVRAEWTWRPGTPHARTVVVNTFQARTTSNDEWFAVVPPDPTDVTVGRVKGDVRPGEVAVTFYASDGSSTVTKTVPARWTYSADRAPEVQMITLGTCSDSGPGTPTRFRVRYLTFGFGDDFGGEGAADTVHVTYTVNTPSGKRSHTVEAQVAPGSLDPQYTHDSGRVLGGWVNAEFTAQAPKFSDCDDVSTQGVVTVTRASDGAPTLFYRQVLAG